MLRGKIQKHKLKSYKTYTIDSAKILRETGIRYPTIL